MERTPQSHEPSDADQLMREAEGAERGRVRELIDFLMHTKKWWLMPVIFALLLFGVLVVLSSTAAAPFIYSLF